MTYTRRGHPDDKTIHLRRPQQRPGMIESNRTDGLADFPTSVECGYGSWHLYFTNNIADCTCQKCIDVRNKVQQPSAEQTDTA